MALLSMASYRLLKKLHRKRTIMSEFTDNQWEQIQILLDEDFINLIEGDALGSLSGEIAYLVFEKKGIRITEKGDAYFESHKRETFHYWFPIIISNIIAISALVISVFSILQ